MTARTWRCAMHVQVSFPLVYEPACQNRIAVSQTSPHPLLPQVIDRKRQRPGKSGRARSRTATRRDATEVSIPTSALMSIDMARTPPAERAPLPCYPSLPSLLPAHYARRCCFAAQNRPRGSSNLPGSHGKGPRSSVGASGGGPEPPMAPGRSPASEMSPSPSPLPLPATPALPPLHPPPLPPAPYRLSPSSSILLPRGQPLRRARVRPHAIACAATASPKPVREDRVGATLRPCACAP